MSVAVTAGAVTVQNPAKGGHVSLRGTMTGSAGAKAEITIIRAYLTA